MANRSMNVTFACPQCGKASRTPFCEEEGSLHCSACGQSLQFPPGAVSGYQVSRCLSCPSEDLYVRKDFPQIVGVSLVGAGILGSSIAWYFGYIYWTYGILFGTALIDLALYAFVGNALMCYRCGAQYRGVDEIEQHGAFNLETHERYRQIAARMEEK